MHGHHEPATHNMGGPQGAGRVLLTTCIVPLGAGGAIAATGVDTPFCTVAKVGGKVGRYLVTPTKPFVKLRFATASVEGDTDAATPIGKATDSQIRNGSGGSFMVQLQIPATGAAVSADAEAQDNAILRIFAVWDRGRI